MRLVRVAKASVAAVFLMSTAFVVPALAVTSTGSAAASDPSDSDEIVIDYDDPENGHEIILDDAMAPLDHGVSRQPEVLPAPSGADTNAADHSVDIELPEAEGAADADDHEIVVDGDSAPLPPAEPRNPQPSDSANEAPVEPGHNVEIDVPADERNLAEDEGHVVEIDDVPLEHGESRKPDANPTPADHFLPTDEHSVVIEGNTDVKNVTDDNASADSGKADKGAADQGVTDQGKADSSKADAEKGSQGSSEQGKADSGNAGNAKADNAKVDSVKTEKNDAQAPAQAPAATTAHNGALARTGVEGGLLASAAVLVALGMFARVLKLRRS